MLQSDYPKILWLVSERSEFVTDLSAVFPLLSSEKLILVPLMLPFSGERFVEKAKVLYKDVGIPIKTLNNYGNKNALGIFLEEKPVLLVTNSDRGFLSRSFVLVAKRLNVPVLVIRDCVESKKPSNASKLLRAIELANRSYVSIPKQFGNYIYYLRTLMSLNPTLAVNFPKQTTEFFNDMTHGIEGASADYLVTTTLGDEFFLKEHLPHLSHIRTVGNPRYDAILNSQKVYDNKQLKKEVREMFNVPHDKEILLFLASAKVIHGLIDDKTNLAVHNEILETLAKFKDHFHIIIKRHPVERDFFSEIWKPEYDEFVSVTTFDLNKLILASDVSLSWYSTTMINVVLARKPLVAMDLFDERNNRIVSPREVLHICDEGAAKEVTTVKGLYEILSLLVKDCGLRERMVDAEEAFHSRYMKEVDGKSAYRIVSTIKDIIYESSNATSAQINSVLVKCSYENCAL